MKFFEQYLWIKCWVFQQIQITFLSMIIIFFKQKKKVKFVVHFFSFFLIQIHWPIKFTILRTQFMLKDISIWKLYPFFFSLCFYLDDVSNQIRQLTIHLDLLKVILHFFLQLVLFMSQSCIFALHYFYFILNQFRSLINFVCRQLKNILSNLDLFRLLQCCFQTLCHFFRTFLLFCYDQNEMCLFVYNFNWRKMELLVFLVLLIIGQSSAQCKEDWFWFF